MSDDYTDILNRARSEIPEPVDVPTGTWKLRAVSGKYTEETVATDDRAAPQAVGMIVWQPISPMADVDEEAYAAFAEDSLDGSRVFANFWLHDLRDIQDLNRVLDAAGLPDLPIRDAIKQIKGYEVVAYVYQKQDTKDPNRWFTNLKQFAPVED